MRAQPTVNVQLHPFKADSPTHEVNADCAEDEIRDLLIDHCGADEDVDPEPNTHYVVIGYDDAPDIGTGDKSPTTADLQTLGELCLEYGDAIVGAALENWQRVGDVESVLRRGAYYGTYKDAADFAEQTTNDINGDVPSYLANYIDWEKMGDDFMRDGYFGVDTGEGFVVFDSNV